MPINVVRQLQELHPNLDSKEFLLRVWKKELGYNCWCFKHIQELCSLPTTINRNRQQIKDEVKRTPWREAEAD